MKHINEFKTKVKEVPWSPFVVAPCGQTMHHYERNNQQLMAEHGWCLLELDIVYGLDTTKKTGLHLHIEATQQVAHAIGPHTSNICRSFSKIWQLPAMLRVLRLLQVSILSQFLAP